MVSMLKKGVLYPNSCISYCIKDRRLVEVDARVTVVEWTEYFCRWSRFTRLGTSCNINHVSRLHELASECQR